VPASEETDEQLLDDVGLPNDDLRELLVNAPPSAPQLTDRFLFRQKLIELFRHGTLLVQALFKAKK
jgi:hypothetical protein